MVAPEKTMSGGGQQALRDMVESEMYLLAQSQQTPWPMLPRRVRRPHQAKRLHRTLVESSAAQELVDQGFVEATSSRTFVVSKFGYQFYERALKLPMA